MDPLSFGGTDPSGRLCGPHPGGERISCGGQALRAENRTLDPETEAVEGLLQAILSGPESETLTNVIPASVSLRGWTLRNGLLTVDLSGSYGTLSGIDLTLADYSMVLTLTQLEEVEAVMITVEGQVLSYRDHQRLTAEDVHASMLQEEPPFCRMKPCEMQIDTCRCG